MKRPFILAFFVTVILGTAWHFLYDAVPCAFTALIAPVNESVWEHLKLSYFPPLLTAIFLSLRMQASQRRFWSAMLSALLLMPIVIVGVYYTLTAGFGVPNIPSVDIPLYFAGIALGWFAAYRLTERGRAEHLLGPLVIAVGVFGAALVVFSIAAPDFPIFIST